jgi:hypothetical protein
MVGRGGRCAKSWEGSKEVCHAVTRMSEAGECKVHIKGVADVHTADGGVIAGGVRHCLSGRCNQMGDKARPPCGLSVQTDCKSSRWEEMGLKHGVGKIKKGTRHWI